MDQSTEHLNELREMAAEVLEIEPEELTLKGSFADDYDADSLRAIEMLARVEKRYQVEIPQEELATITDLASFYACVARHAGWPALAEA